MEQSPLEANRFLASQEIHRILRNSSVRYGIHKCPPPVPILSRLHKDTTPTQPDHTVTPTHIEPEQYNPWNNSTNKSQAPEDGCTNILNMLSSK